MGKRGPNSFRRLDAERAIRSAREAGLEPAMIEIVAKDGTTFRVYGHGENAEMAGAGAKVAKEWIEEIAKLKAKSKA